MLSGEELGRAIRAAIDAKGITQKVVAAEFGVKQPSVSDWIKYGRIDKKHLSHLMVFFSDVVGPAHWGLSEQTVWTPVHHAAEGTPVYGVAQDLIHPTFEDEPTTCTWEFILSAAITDLPPRFSAAVPDDALAPVTPRGTGYIFATGPAAPGDGVVVIVQAGNGRRYMRLYFAGAGDEWEARARDPAHRALHSVRDELVLLASATHRAGGQG